MRKWSLPFVVAAAIVLALPQDSAAATKLRVANWLPPVHHMSKTLRAWADELEKASGGAIAVEVMTAPLAKPDGQYDLARKGIVDIAWSVAAYHPKRFWKLMAVETPFAAPTAEAAGVAAWRWYSKQGFLAEDTADTKLLALFAHAPHLYHSAKPLTKLADFKDLKIRAGGNGVKIARILGAVPVFMPPGATHDSLAKGTLDASQFPWESVKGFRLAGVTTHHLKVPGGTYAGIFFLTMSPKTWARLSDGEKTAVDKVSGEWGSRFISKKWDEAERDGIAAVEANGNTITILSAAETERLKEMVRPITDEWVEKANEAGLDGRALLADHRAIVSGL